MTMREELPFPYTIKRSARAKYLRVDVNDDATVDVVVPERLKETEIEAFLRKKIRWVQKHRAFFLAHAKSATPTDGNDYSYSRYKARAKKIIVERLRVMNEYYRYEYARVTVKNLSSRWGSCSKEKNLNFHYKLMFLPEELLDYVIVHELCHLKELNHSARFWTLVGQVIPDYKKRRQELRKYKS